MGSNNSTFMVYHFIYNEAGRCLKDEERHPHTYLDSNDNTFKLSYESCALCYKEGNISNNNCIYCLKGALFHSYELINGSDFTAMVLSSDDMNPKEQIKKGISAIDLGNCTEQIKEYYNISKNESLIILNSETKRNETKIKEEKDANDDSIDIGKKTRIEIQYFFYLFPYICKIKFFKIIDI